MSFPRTVLSAVQLAITASLFFVCLACGSKEVEVVTPEPPRGYRPFSASYHGITRARIEQTYNNQAEVNNVGMHYYLAVEVAAADSQLNAKLVLDSITEVQGIPAQNLSARTDSALGVQYEGILAPDGTLSDLTGGESGGSLAEELADRVIRPFFPVIPEPGVEPGTTWSDTLQTTASLGGVENSVRALREHRAREWTTYAGQPALLIETTSSYTFTGSGVQVGQEFTLEGEGRRHTSQYLGADGRFLGFVSADTADAAANLKDAGITIPVHQTRADTLTIMP
jgi:hypothetical protein